MSRPATLVALLALAAGAFGVADAAQRPRQTWEERELLDSVQVAMRHRDCAAAVTSLNRGLAQKLPDAYLLAGTMYEEGLCLKRSWERAAELYSRAASIGHVAGTYRLIAGLAQREPGSALWWAQRTGQAMPAPCRVADAVHGDAQAYAAALNGWPPGHVAACAYSVGVAASVIGDTEYPGESIGQALEATVTMEFTPAEGRMDWQTVETRALDQGGLRRGEPQQDRAAQGARERIRLYLEDLGRRALARHARPEGIDAGWKIKVVYEFSLH